eukprot:1149538_1
MATTAQRHPRELIREALAQRQLNQPDNPLGAGHFCFVVVSFIVAICVLIYEVQFVILKDDTTVSDKMSKWMKSNQVSSVRYLNNISEISGYNDYDYVIIGAGIAGSVLATKLATDETYPRVLVIESRTMRALLQDKQNKVTAFAHIDEGDQLPVHSNNNNYFWTRSSPKIHNNIWSIGAPTDYDTLWNITDWKWRDIVPYFKQSERVLIDEVVHEFGIKMHGSTPRPRQSLVERIFSMLPLGADRDSFSNSDNYYSYGDREVFACEWVYCHLFLCISDTIRNIECFQRMKLRNGNIRYSVVRL